MGCNSFFFFVVAIQLRWVAIQHCFPSATPLGSSWVLFVLAMEGSKKVTFGAAAEVVTFEVEGPMRRCCTRASERGDGLPMHLAMVRREQGQRFQYATQPYNEEMQLARGVEEARTRALALCEELDELFKELRMSPLGANPSQKGATGSVAPGSPPTM